MSKNGNNIIKYIFIKIVNNKIIFKKFFKKILLIILKL